MTCENPASGAQTSHWYVAETTCGVTPTSPTWLPLRYTKGGMVLTKDSMQSAELDGSREVADIRLGSGSTSGDIEVELSYGSYNDLLEAALGGTWTSQSDVTSVTCDIVPAGNHFLRSTGSFVTDGFKPGDLIRVTGPASSVNKQLYVIQAVTALRIYVSAPATTLVAESAVSCTFKRPYKLEVGTTRRSFSILTHYADADGGAGEYHITRGVEITGYSFNVAVNSNITGKFSTIGLTYSPNEALPSGSTFGSTTKTTVYANVDGVILDVSSGTSYSTDPIGYLTSLDIKLDNAASAQYVLNNDSVGFIERGRANNTLSMSAFFFDSTLLNKFVAEEESAIAVAAISDSGANCMRFGRIVYTSGAPEIAGEGSITQSLEAQALKGTAGESSIQWQYLSAT